MLKYRSKQAYIKDIYIYSQVCKDVTVYGGQPEFLKYPKLFITRKLKMMTTAQKNSHHTWWPSVC